MPDIIKNLDNKSKLIICICLCLVLLAGWIPFFGGIDIFMGFWRVETACSIFLLSTLTYLIFKYRKSPFYLSVSKQELIFIIFPLLAFIFWSGLSMIWATSWKSALYHTLIWIEYLIFYLIIRHFLESPHFYKTLLNCLTIMILIIALPPIIEYCGFLYLGDGNTSLGIRFSKYGEQFLALFPLITAGVLRLSGRRFLLGICLLTAMWLFMVSTLSRTNFLLFIFATIAIAVIIFFFKQFRKYRKKFSFVIAAFITSFLFVNSISLLAEKSHSSVTGRLLDTSSTSYSNNFRKLMIPISTKMIAAHPFIGIGAGNFGMQFNKYREIYADKHPDDINLMTAENELAERAHNEYLQIFAELGIIGLAIFLFLISSIGFMSLNLLGKIRSVSLFPITALLGLYLFLISSMVTSYSFRFMQNGLVFFIVLAIAVKLFSSSKVKKKADETKYIAPKYLKAVCGVGIVACLLLIGYCGVKVISTIYTIRARNTSNIEESIPLYQKAIGFDDENPNPYYFLGMELIKTKRYSEAVPNLKQSILKGLGTSSTYSYLATAETLAGNSSEAQKDFTEAVKLYPQSVFARTRYAYLLLNDNKPDESEKQLETAFAIDKKQANTWGSLMNHGLSKTMQTSFQNDNYAPVESLLLRDCVEAIKFEREIKNPAEKVEFNFNELGNNLPN